MVSVKRCKTSKLCSLKGKPCCHRPLMGKRTRLTEWKTACGCCNCAPAASFIAERGAGTASFTNCSHSWVCPFALWSIWKWWVSCPWEATPDPFRWMPACCWWWKDWGKNGNGWKQYQSKESLRKCFWKSNKSSFYRFCETSAWSNFFFVVITILIFCMNGQIL